MGRAAACSVLESEQPDSLSSRRLFLLSVLPQGRKTLIFVAEVSAERVSQLFEHGPFAVVHAMPFTHPADLDASELEEVCLLDRVNERADRYPRVFVLDQFRERSVASAAR